MQDLAESAEEIQVRVKIREITTTGVLTLKICGNNCVLMFCSDLLSITAAEATYFESLCTIRRQLELEDIFIICAGSSMDVFPSPMALSMGEGRTAYRLLRGRRSSSSDLIDIFDTHHQCITCTVAEQEHFYQQWLRSLAQA